MTRTDAIRQCKQEAQELGGEWHVVKIIDLPTGYFSVNSAWFKRHDGKSIFKAGKIESPSFDKKQNVVRKVITYFNKFLLWLMKKLINARANKSNT